ncbi:MATE family efflux transporter [Amaricoccus sp.]|mgnify:CR=1 FL=1|uniref:MATE family efflux transporter n=1 Tax=Amaricoccus sp. TaxID=1872485 RepID=UPI0026187648|nr:MATE family efflux transporter [Amaricoccus sp.]HRO12240.1 MATE family efflux transporter [Amaricoccus sp.]
MARARFTEGSTLRHVVVMTLTGAIGLTFMFLIDAATLFWVSRLGDERLVAALGFAWTVIFFIISSGIGIAIAATALVSRSLGEGDIAGARIGATSALVITFLVQAAVAALVVAFRDPLLALAGARGEAAAEASRFLLVTSPAMPFLALGMTGGSILRAAGDAWRSMSVTLVAGLIAMVLDPIFIILLDFRLEGAAWVMVAARGTSGLLAIWYLLRPHRLLGPARPRQIAGFARPFFLIALPASVTQLSTPFGNYLLTSLIAAHGDGAVAGWAVVTRMTVLAFGGIFALSGAIGGILGQNYGARLMSRVRSTYRDALLFCAAYTAATWAILFLLRHQIVAVFRLGPEGAEVFLAFVGLAAGGFVFTGALFVANAAFNTLGRPLRSTLFNWTRDGLAMYPLAWALSNAVGAPGVVYGQALAGVVVGTVAAVAGWRFVKHLAPPGRTLESGA